MNIMKNIYAILFLGCLFQSCSSEAKKTNQLDGKIEREQLSITTKIPGRVVQVLVQEGDLVQAGDTLLILDFPEVDAKSQQAQGALDAAKAQYDMAVKGATDNQMKQLYAKRDGLQEQFDFADKSLNRMTNLLADSLVSQQKYDEVYMKYQGAKNQYLAVQAELADAQHGARIEQQKMALGQKERALGAVSEIAVATNERYIIAPQQMSIEAINLKVGELALAGYSIINGYITGSTFFRITVGEKQLASFFAGSKHDLRFPYLADKIIQGEVTSVKPLPAYANISSAYPDFEQQEALFEVKLKAVQAEEAKQLLTTATFTLQLTALKK